MATPEIPRQRPPKRRGQRTDAGAPTVHPAARGEVTGEARYAMIQEAAYRRAERRGFEPGFELDDWIAAENEIDTLLAEGRGSTSQ